MNHFIKLFNQAFFFRAGRIEVKWTKNEKKKLKKILKK